MNRRLALLLLTAAWSTFAFADPLKLPDNSVVAGWRDANVDGSKSGVAEYEETDGSPVLGVDFSTVLPNGNVSVQVDHQGTDAQRHSIRFDIGPVVRSLTTFRRLPHNLVHDSMDNLEAATKAGRQLWHDDANAGSEYGYRYSALDHRTEFAIGDHVTLAGTYNQQWRKGHAQAYAISHCEGCHVQSQARPLDEDTRTIGADATFAFNAGSITAGYSTRELRQNVPFVTNQYDRAVHPELRSKIFDNRVIYGLGEGPLPIDLRPDIDKDVSRVDFQLPNLAGFTVAGGGVWSETQNQYTGLTSEYAGYALSAARMLPGKWRMTWRGRAYTIDNDDIYIDVPDTISGAGPQAGKTYKQVYGYDPDWMRYSGLDRDVIDSRFEIGRRLGKKGGNLRFTWAYSDIDRDHYEVAAGATDTRTNVLGVAWNTRIAKKLRLDVRLSHGMVDNPMTNVDGTCSTFTSIDVASPLDPRAGQYWQIRDAKIGDASADPASWDELRAGISYIAGRGVLSANGRYWTGENQEGDLTDWSRDKYSLALNYSYSPSEQWSWFAGATLLDSSTKSPVCIGLFDG